MRVFMILMLFFVIGCKQDNQLIDYKSNKYKLQLDDSLDLYMFLDDDKSFNGMGIYKRGLDNKGVFFNKKSKKIDYVFSNLPDSSTVYYSFYENGNLQLKSNVKNNLKTKDYLEYYDTGEIYSYRYYLKEGNGRATFVVRYNENATVDFENLNGSSLVYLEKKTNDNIYIFKTIVPPYFEEKLYYIIQNVKHDDFQKDEGDLYHLPIPSEGDSVIINITLTNRVNGQNFSEEITLGH